MAKLLQVRAKVTFSGARETRSLINIEEKKNAGCYIYLPLYVIKQIKQIKLNIMVVGHVPIVHTCSFMCT